MDDGPYWVISLMYGSHDMKHRGFRRLTVVNGTLENWDVTENCYCFLNLVFSMFFRTKKGNQKVCLVLVFENCYLEQFLKT